jgi:NAD-dependent SIR2 family protein deacetylase
MQRPHFVLVGAGASKAALPHGDKNGLDLPLLRDVAADLALAVGFPDDLRELAETDFEAAYSRLYDRDQLLAAPIEEAISAYFRQLRLPDEATLYDALLLSLRSKDSVFTFNWDPLLFISRVRLNQRGLTNDLPDIFYLHGNVIAAYCERDGVFGYTNGQCSQCGQPFTPTRLLFPVEHKDYNTDPGIRAAWEAAHQVLKSTFMLTVFGYSAPVTDVEAFDLLRQGWGEVAERNMEQTEIIHRPGADTEQLVERWRPFIHTHHYELHDSFYASWLGKHPRRSGEAYLSQYIDAQFIEDNPVPQGITDVDELVAWFQPLLDSEHAAGIR